MINRLWKENIQLKANLSRMDTMQLNLNFKDLDTSLDKLCELRQAQRKIRFSKIDSLRMSQMTLRQLGKNTLRKNSVNVNEYEHIYGFKKNIDSKKRSSEQLGKLNCRIFLPDQIQDEKAHKTIKKFIIKDDESFLSFFKT